MRVIKRIMLYISIVFGVAIWAILYENYEMSLLLLLLMIMPLLFYFMLYISNRKLEVKHKVNSDKVLKGQNIPVFLNINNGGIFPIILMKIKIQCVNEFYGVTNSEVFEMLTLKRGKQNLSFSLKSMYCGNIKIILKEIIISDYFSLFSFTKKFNLEEVIPVIPDIKIIECDNVPNNMHVFMDGEIYSKDKKGDDPSEVFDIREYREGDDLHSIHWKLSAKKDAYVVKELSLPLSSGIVLMVEINMNNKDRYKHKKIDAIIDTVIAMSIKLQECGYYHYIAWYDKKSKACMRMQVTELTQISDIASNIYKSRIYADGPKVIDAYNKEFYEDTESHVYYISSVLDEKIVDELKHDRENAFINHIAITSGEENISEDFQNLLEANDISFQIVSCNNLNNTIESLSF